jgi:hypothetical protein
MEGKQVSAEELKRVLAADFDRLAEDVAEAMNAAQDGRIIADREEPVRDASAEFRKRMFEKAIGLLQKKQEAFSPSAPRTEEQGQAGDHSSDDQRTNQHS